MMLPHAARSRVTLPEVATRRMSATLPAFVMANSIASFPFRLSSDSGIRRNQFCRIMGKMRFQIRTKIHALRVAEDVEASSRMAFCSNAKSEILIGDLPVSGWNWNALPESNGGPQ